jgi:hypothetical protein
MDTKDPFGFTPFHFLVALVVFGVAAIALIHHLFG